MKTKLNEKSTADKIMLVLRVVISLVVLVAAVLQITGVWDKALNVAIPLLSVLILIQSIQEHNSTRKIGKNESEHLIFEYSGHHNTYCRVCRAKAQKIQYCGI